MIIKIALCLLAAGFIYLIWKRRLGFYVLKRVLLSLFSLLAIISVVFVLLRQMPIEGYFDNYDKLDEAQVQAKLHTLGLDRPILQQLIPFLKNLLKGDLGQSSRYSAGTSISQIIAEKAPISIYLGVASMGLGLLFGIPLGAAMALKKGAFWDRFGTVFIVLINAVPAAVYYIFIQLYGTDLLRIGMLFKRNEPVTWILPVISMSLGSIASYAMWLRRYMLDEINKDYVKLARSKGISPYKLMLSHVFRNSFVPMVQYIPASLLYTVCGSIYVESLYSIPGMGGLLVDVIGRQDNPMVQALVMIFSCIGIVGLLLGDLLMAMLDPRISLERRQGVR
ncbi:MAG: ABC transporter permease [Clostridiales bacterium]|nr:ABC transporter permease [Clostridiales bacterium]